MIKTKPRTPKLSLLFLLSLLMMQFGCKKIDLERLAAVTTDEVDNVSANQATVYGAVIDLGSDETLTDYGFCWARNKVPTISDQFHSYGITSVIGSYFFTMNGLVSSSNYQVRAYVKEGSQVTYGNIIEFMTDQGIGPSPVWYHYDDGVNADGIGFNDGTDFDVAIRIPSSDLQQFGGFRVDRIRFYAREDFPVGYTVTIWEGSGPTLVYSEPVFNPVVDGWTDFYLSMDHYINTGADLWIGYYIENHIPDEYPAGTDNGPAIAGFGDLISTNNGQTWSLLSDQGLNYNWNIQVYITNEKSKEVQLVKKTPVIEERLQKPEKTGTPGKIVSENNSGNKE